MSYQLVTFGPTAHTMAPKLYMIPQSPPVRAVLMTAKSLGINLELEEIDLAKGDHRTPQFLKLNPQHTVPTLVDAGFAIWDSHAIMTYLINKYGKDDSIYPKDPKKRAVVEQRLHFDGGVVFALALKILRPAIYQGKKTIDQEDIDAAEEVYSFVETFLEGSQWIAGDSATIADYSLGTSIPSLGHIVKIDPSKYPRLVAWIKRVESLPVYDKSGLDAFERVAKSLWG